MGEIDQLDNPIDHRVAERDERNECAGRQPIEAILQQQCPLGTRFGGSQQHGCIHALGPPARRTAAAEDTRVIGRAI